MALTVIWAFAVVVLCAIFWKKPLAVAGIVISSYALVPLSASSLTIYFKPGDYFIIIFFILFILRYGLTDILKGHGGMTSAVLFIAIFAGISRFMGYGSLGSTILLILRIVIFPYMLYLIIAYVLREKLDTPKSFAVPILLTLLFEFSLSILQNATGKIILWESAIRSQWWVDSNYEVSQPLGTFGHWIPLSVFIALGVVVTSYFKNRIWFYIVIIPAIYILALSAARSGIIAFVFLVFLIIASDLLGGTAKNRIIAFMAVPIILVSGAVIFFGEAGESFRNKLVDDNNSTSLRLRAISWFWNNINDYMVTAYPKGSNLREIGALTTSLENAFYIFAMQFGFISMILLLGLLVVLLAKTIFIKNSSKMLALGVTISFIFSCFTNGAFSVGEFTSLMLFWSIMAFAGYQRTGLATKDSDI